MKGGVIFALPGGGSCLPLSVFISPWRGGLLKGGGIAGPAGPAVSKTVLLPSRRGLLVLGLRPGGLLSSSVVFFSL